MTVRFAAVLFDYGGVLSPSPFQVFAAHERERGLPEGFIRRLNATNPDTNAWSQLERSTIEMDEFVGLFEAEANEAGGSVDAKALMIGLRGAPIEEMLRAVRACRRHCKTALLTNNWVADHRMQFTGGDPATTFSSLFDVVVQSALEGVRKPDPAFYRVACDRLGVDPAACVFLDDLGVNLKPARAMGMTTIKVTSHEQALDDLEAVLGVTVR